MHDLRQLSRDGVFLFSLALLIRVLYLAWVGRNLGFGQFSDSLYLHELAASLAAGRGFTLDGLRVFNQSPGYPFALAPLYGLLGTDTRVMAGFNVLLGALGVVLVYGLSLRLFTPAGASGSEGGITPRTARGIARTAGLLAAVYPDSLVYSPLGAAENLLIPLMLLLLLAVLTKGGTGVWRPLALGLFAGALAAAGALVKAHVMFLCLLVPVIWKAAHERWMLRSAGAMTAGLLCLLPWTLANYRDSGYMVPLSAVSGEVLLASVHPSATGQPTDQYRLAPEIEQGQHPVALDKLRMKEAIGHIRAAPRRFVTLSLRKVILSFSPARDWVFEHDGHPRLFTRPLSRWLPTLFNALVLTGIGAGLWLCRKTPRALATGLALLSGSILLQLVFAAYSRYRFPFLFCLLPFCARAGAAGLAKITRHGGNGVQPGEGGWV